MQTNVFDMYNFRNTSGVIPKAFIQRKSNLSEFCNVQNDYLSHSGILGMRWGIRRYQNPDGTLTEEGKRRYGVGNSEGRQIENESKHWKKSDAKYLSDEELRKRNNRLQAERQYKELTTTDSEREKEQYKKDLKRKLIAAAIVTPLVAIAGAVGRKYIASHSDKITKAISNYGKVSVSKIKTANSSRNLLKLNQSKYMHPHGSRGMLTSTGGRINSVKTLYNYRPYNTWNIVEKANPWPKL